MSTRIHVTFTEPGWHHWPGAPEHRSYLAARHRHVFYYDIEMEVWHGDREVEFHDLIDQVRSYLPADGEHGAQSCEDIAGSLLSALSGFYPGDRNIAVTVSEDNECGATVTQEGT